MISYPQSRETFAELREYKEHFGERGKTGIIEPDTGGNIPNNTIYTTIGMSSSLTSNVLGHEFGHGIDFAKNPLGTFTLAKNDPNHDCQDAGNRNSTLSKTARDWQDNYDDLYKKYLTTHPDYNPNKKTE